MTVQSAPEPHGESTSDIAFDVVDVLEGMCTLEKRSPTFDGSVPLRVAQACVPLLEGNAFGYQVVLHRRIELRRKLTGFAPGAWAREEDTARLHRAALPMAAVQGLLTPGTEWTRMLEGGVVVGRAPFGRGRSPVLLFTGLYVRPRPGTRLRVSSTKNRRALTFAVREAMIDDTSSYVPLVLEIEPLADAAVLTGEVATLAALPARVRLSCSTLEASPDVADAHLAFYDAAYFATKRGGDVARKYRRAVALSAADASRERDVECAAELVEAGPIAVEPARPALFHRPSGPATDAAAAPDRWLVRNAVPFRVTFDGADVAVAPDEAVLEAFARDVRARWRSTFTRAAERAHEGALLYLTKYFTPHPRGEPHFFVKPPALVRTPVGTSLLIEGASGDGYEIMRGVVESDRFHAAPAVFHLTHAGRRVEVAHDAPLAELHPVPRWLAASGFALRRAGVVS